MNPSKHRSLWMPVICTLAVLGGCASSGLTPEEREARATAIAAAQADMEAEIERRLAAGEAMPERVDNDVYSVAICVSPVPPDNAVSVRSPVMLARFVCENTAAGQWLLAWRAWYCAGKEAARQCVLGGWPNGVPSYSGVLDQQMTVNMGGGSVFTFRPPQWQPGG